jgi:hypothetical protein
MSRVHGTNGGEGIVRDLATKPAEIESLEDLSVDGRIISKCVKGIRWEKE